MGRAGRDRNAGRKTVSEGDKLDRGRDWGPRRAARSLRTVSPMPSQAKPTMGGVGLGVNALEGPGEKGAAEAREKGCQQVSSPATQDWHLQVRGRQKAANSRFRVPGTVGVPGKDTVDTGLIDTTVGSGHPLDTS